MGVDNIAVDTATEMGIAVTSVPDYCVDEVADHVMALLLALNRRVVLFDRATKTKGWGSEGLSMRIMRLDGKSLGIVGFGRIGRAVCVRALAFGLNVFVSDPFVSSEAVENAGAELVDVEKGNDRVKEYLVSVRQKQKTKPIFLDFIYSKPFSRNHKKDIKTYERRIFPD